MKLYSVVLPLLIFAAFGYFWHTVDKTADAGNKINVEAAKEEFKEDFHDVEAAFAKGGSANHNRYNQ